MQRIQSEPAVPIYSPDQLREMTPERLLPTKPAPDPGIVICTLAPSDNGDWCRACGHPSGSGHAKERR